MISVFDKHQRRRLLPPPEDLVDEPPDALPDDRLEPEEYPPERELPEDLPDVLTAPPLLSLDGGLEGLTVVPVVLRFPGV